MNAFNGVKVFSATKAADRDRLGDVVTAWLRSNPHFEIVDKQITQSSDQAFHCLVITIFYKEAASGSGSSRSRAAAKEG